MSFNGSGTFQINSSGQPVITGTVISSTAFNALTADLATGLSTCVTKDGQTATTVRVPFAFGISSTLTTDATSATTGSIITAGGISMQKALWVGTTSRHVGAATFDSTIASGAITSTGAISGTNLTASGKVGIGAAVDASAPLYILDNTEYGIRLRRTTATAVDSYLYPASDGKVTLSGAALNVQNALSVGVSVTAPYYTTTATGTNGLGLAAANTPAFYASTTEVMRSTTSLATVQLELVTAAGLYSTKGTQASTSGTWYTIIALSEGLWTVYANAASGHDAYCVVCYGPGGGPTILTQVASAASVTFQLSSDNLQVRQTFGTVTITWSSNRQRLT